MEDSRRRVLDNWGNAKDYPEEGPKLAYPRSSKVPDHSASLQPCLFFKSKPLLFSHTRRELSWIPVGRGDQAKEGSIKFSRRMADLQAIDLPSLQSVTTEQLKAELFARQAEGVRPVCGGSHGPGSSYNTPLHVFALVLILVLSTIACSFPIIARRFPRLPIPHRFLFLSRHFGTGVLIATAFVHLLPTAFVSLTDPCLPPFWTESYPASAGLIAMIFVFTVVGTEMFFAIRGAGHAHATEYGMVDQEDQNGRESLMGNGAKPATGGASIRHFQTKNIGTIPEEDEQRLSLQETPPMDSEESGFVRNGWKQSASRAQVSTNSISLDESKTGLGESHRSPGSSQTTPKNSLDADALDLEDRDDLNDPMEAHANGTFLGKATSTVSLSAQQQEEQKAVLQCFLLEAGILFHSVFIGMALSVAVGTPFIVLLIAISFHQTFEGLALGSRIAAISSFGPSSPKPWLMALCYGITTPIGQAIGLGVHNLYDPESEMGLLMVGIMNAISSGLLLFAGLVELLAEDFLSDKSYEQLRGKKRLHACGAVVAGSLLMALVGAWA